MTLGVPYQAACDMPIDMAIAFLSVDERQSNNTRPVEKTPSPAPVKKASGKTYVASRYKNSGMSKP